MKICSLHLVVVCVRRLAWALVATTCAAGNGAFAQHELADTVCTEGEKFYPNGRIVTLGHSKFHLCNSTAYKTPDGGAWKSIHVGRESGVDAALAETYPGLRYSGSVRYETYEGGHPYAGFVPLGATIDLGGVKYAALVPSYSFEKADTALERGKLLAWTVLHAVKERDMPEHYLICNYPPNQPRPEGFFCRLTVVYSVDDNLYISQIFNERKRSEKGGDALSFLPDHVRGLQKAYEALDVTKSGD